MKYTPALIIFILPLFFSCKTTDMEKRGNTGGVYAPSKPGAPEAPPEGGSFETPKTIVTERPVYMPENSPAPGKPPASGQAAVRESNAAGIITPSEYSHAAMIYDYNADWVYEVYTKPLRVTDIRLEPGEKAVETPFISDSARWLLGAGVSYENGLAVQHIYVKPAEASIEASLILNTDRRVYHIILKSFQTSYMPMVRWRHASAAFPNNYIPAAGAEAAGPEGGPDTAILDPRFISFNYRVRRGLFRKPAWLPELVCDDGKKTYIVFPKTVLHAALPAVFDERKNAVNYRVLEHVVILDKLMQKITVKLDGREITVEKKRG